MTCLLTKFGGEIWQVYYALKEEKIVIKKSKTWFFLFTFNSDKIIFHSETCVIGLGINVLYKTKIFFNLIHDVLIKYFVHKVKIFKNISNKNVK